MIHSNHTHQGAGEFKRHKYVACKPKQITEWNVKTGLLFDNGQVMYFTPNQSLTFDALYRRLCLGGRAISREGLFDEIYGDPFASESPLDFPDIGVVNQYVGSLRKLLIYSNFTISYDDLRGYALEYDASKLTAIDTPNQRLIKPQNNEVANVYA